MNKKEVEKNIELDNLQFSRLYKKSFYWILSTNDKETIICSWNYDHILYIKNVLWF